MRTFRERRDFGLAKIAARLKGIVVDVVNVQFEVDRGRCVGHGIFSAGINPRDLQTRGGFRLVRRIIGSLVRCHVSRRAFVGCEFAMIIRWFGLTIFRGSSQQRGQSAP